jgi:hypothetical protein
MGMDVHGHAPTAEVGEYFRANIWTWHPLWHYCCKVYPPCREVAGHYNDGDGLDAERSAELAATLQAHLEAGHTAAYAAICQAEIDALPNSSCPFCQASGQGTTVHADGYVALSPEFACYHCEGTGSAKPLAAYFRLDVEVVRAFAEFCAASGGFSIY